MPPFKGYGNRLWNGVYKAGRVGFKAGKLAYRGYRFYNKYKHLGRYAGIVAGAYLKGRSMKRGNTEVKHRQDAIGTEAAPTSVYSTAVVTYLNTIEQGLGYNQRIGVSVKVISMQLRMVFKRGTVPVEAASMVRWMLVEDLFPDGTTPAVTSIIGDGSTYHVGSIRNPNPSAHTRYRVWMDKVFRLDTNDTEMVIKNWFWKGNKHWKFANNLGTVAANSRGAMFLIQLSNEPITANAPVRSYGSWQVRYVDD